MDELPAINSINLVNTYHHWQIAPRQEDITVQTIRADNRKGYSVQHVLIRTQTQQIKSLCWITKEQPDKTVNRAIISKHEEIEIGVHTKRNRCIWTSFQQRHPDPQPVHCQKFPEPQNNTVSW
jgi:hypothetical protein